jgi:hypothetical protein
VTDREEVGYDKMGLVRWLVDAIRGACMQEYSLGKYVTVDEMMIWYKGSYCPARQYMPNKPEKKGGGGESVVLDGFYYKICL